MRTAWNIINSYESPVGGPILFGHYDVFNYAFVCIHKNAHTWASNLLKTNFDFAPMISPHNLIRPDAKYMVILRDPIDRWISGFAQYFSKYDSIYAENLLSNEAFLELVFDTLRFDTHTNLQVEYLLNIPVDNCVFFKQEKNLEENFTKFVSTLVKGKEITPVTDINLYNYRSTNLYKNRLGDTITCLIEDNEKFRDKLVDYTKPDRELMEFVNTNNLWYDSIS